MHQLVVHYLIRIRLADHEEFRLARQVELEQAQLRIAAAEEERDAAEEERDAVEVRLATIPAAPTPPPICKYHLRFICMLLKDCFSFPPTSSDAECHLTQWQRSPCRVCQRPKQDPKAEGICWQELEP